jgi:thiamine pyrophosphokinase
MLAEGKYSFIQHSSASEDFSLLRNVQRIVIFANGELPELDKARSLLQSDDYIICADGGTRHAMALGARPNLVIGDLDSAEQTALQKYKNEGVTVESYPRDKNETDLELAIHHAAELNPKQILVMAALGGRLDQTLANIALLSDAKLSTFDVRLDDGVEEIFLCRDQVQVHGMSGDIVSLIPWQGAASKVQTKNLKWVLTQETLFPDKTRGISNEMIGDTAAISIDSGLLLVVHRRTPLVSPHLSYTSATNGGTEGG